MQNAAENRPWLIPAPDVQLEKKTLKVLMRRNDWPGLIRLALCIAVIAALGWLYTLAWGSWLVVPALIAFGSTMSLTTYSLSHECAHGTAFRSRWLNETIFWISSLIFGEEPLYRRYAHASHHTYTMYVEKDRQMPFFQPAKVSDYLGLYTAVTYGFLFIMTLIRHTLGKFAPETMEFTPPSELPRLQRNARAFLAVYALGAGVSVYMGTWALVTYWLLAKLAGDPLMMLYIGTQHYEMKENTPELRESTRSIKPNRIADLFYWNMSYHIEHHLYPTVPFHALPHLNAVLREKLPRPKGLWAINLEIVRAVLDRQRQPALVPAE